jgi:hypothetical protein
MAMVAMLTLVACEQETGPIPYPLGDNEISASPGRIHNEMISYYYTYRSATHHSHEEIISEVLALSWEYLEKHGYETHNLGETKRAIVEKFKTSYLKSLTTDAYVLDNESFVSQLSATGRFTPRFVSELNKVLDLARDHDDRLLIREYVNSAFQDIEFERQEDNEARSLFTDIFNASYGFWEDRYPSGLKSTMLERSSWVIINDGIGGVLGSIFGPIGTVVVATAFSVGTNEELNR